MARYTVGITAAAAAAGAPYMDIRTTATDRAFLLELGIFVSTAVASSVGLVRSTAVGTASTTSALRPEDSGDPAGTALAGSVWSANPTLDTVYLRRANFAANIGAGVIWTFGGRGLVIPVSSSLVIANFGAAAGAALNIYAVIDE